MGGGSWTGVRSVNGGSGEDEMLMGSVPVVLVEVFDRLFAFDLPARSPSSPTPCTLRRFLVPVIGISLREFVGVGVGKLVMRRGDMNSAESRCPFGLV